MDIDKAYIMGYGFNKSSQYETWTNLASYSNAEELSILEKLPVPTGKVSTLDPINGVDLTPEFDEFSRITKISADTTNVSDIDLNFEEVKIMSEALRKLKSSKKQGIKLTSIDQTRDNLFLALINKHNMFTDFMDGKNAVKNSVISKIKQVISMPSNQLLANEPVDVQSLHTAARKAGAELNTKLLSSWDMISYFKQQRDAAVGKDGVGIGANGLKVFLTVSNYYNDWYKTINDNGLIKDLDLRTNPKSFRKLLTINGEKMDIHTISDTKVTGSYIDKILNDYGYDKFNNNLKVLNSKAALFMSAFISGATDNAKELVMAKINAVSELAGMHLYLLSLGISMDDVAKYMNSDIVKYLLKSLSQNSFRSTERLFIPQLVVNYTLEHNEDPEFSEESVKTFNDIYEGGQEFKVLARLLKINQKTAANTQELNSFLSTFNYVVYARENAVLGESVKNLRNPELWDYTKGKNDLSIVNKILLRNANFSDNPEKYKQYVTDTLTKANNIDVETIDEHGMLVHKNVSLIGGQFDFRYYMNTNNTEYRKATVEYYNLFKNTVNIFDVIENSPHFKAMIDGVSTIHNILLISSKKYNFIFSKARDIIRENSEILQKNNADIKTWQGNPAFPIDIDDRILGRLMVSYDKFLVSSWLKSEGKINTYQFKVSDWLNIAGMKSIELYTDDSAKIDPVGAFQSKTKPINLTGKFINVTNTDNNYILDLSSDTGIANFKMLMEKIGMKIISKSENNNLSNSLKLTSMKNPFGLFTTQITSTFGISSLNSPINLDKFQELLNEFNTIDRTIEPGLKIKNSNGNNVNWQDLFYLYNLVVNNESYGDKRLTPLFEDYIKQKQAIGWDYLNYSSSVDTGKVDIFAVPDTGDMNKNITFKNNQDNDIMFLAFHKNGVLKLSRNKTGENFSVNLKNSNYVINTFMDITSNKDVGTYITMNKIMTTLRNKNLLINFNCN